METINPEQVQLLDRHIPQTESYKKQQADIEKLKANDEEMLKDLENLKTGQEALSKDLEHVKEEVEGMGKEMKEVKDMVQAGFKDLTKTMADHIEQSKNNKIDELTKKLDGRDYVKNGIIITLVGGIVLYIVIGGLKLSLGIEG